MLVIKEHLPPPQKKRGNKERKTLQDLEHLMFYFQFEQNMLLMHLLLRPSQVYVPQLQLIEDPWVSLPGTFLSKHGGAKTPSDSAAAEMANRRAKVKQPVLIKYWCWLAPASHPHVLFAICQGHAITGADNINPSVACAAWKQPENWSFTPYFHGMKSFTKLRKKLNKIMINK